MSQHRFYIMSTHRTGSGIDRVLTPNELWQIPLFGVDNKSYVMFFDSHEDASAKLIEKKLQLPEYKMWIERITGA